MKRAQIGLRTKLAAALLALEHISYDDAKLMTEEQIISLYHFDHGILHAHDGPNAFWNLTPRLIKEHREKTRKDIAIVAKVKRLARLIPAPGTNAYLPAKPKHKWPSRPIPSRPFQKHKNGPRRMRPKYREGRS